MRLLAGFLFVVLAAAVVAPVGSGRSASTVVIRVKSVLVASNVVKDVLPKGPSKGDVAVDRDDLFNVARQFDKPSGARVGTDRVTLTVLGPTSVHVQGTARFPDGTITFTGTGKATSPTGTLTVPVVGGTGRYAHARGTVTAGGQATNVNSYRFRLP